MRETVESEERDGVVVTSYRFLEKRNMARLIPGIGTDPSGVPVTHVAVEKTDVYQIGVELKGGSIVFEPGAFQYSHGKIGAELIRHEPDKGFFSRAVASAGTGESPYANKLSGVGTIWGEPKRSHFIVGTMDGPDDALLLDDKAFYACTSGIALSTHVHKAVSGALSGNGLMQPKITGSGIFVVESPVPVEELDVIELEGGEAIIDGDYMLMYSAKLDVAIGPLVEGVRNAMRSGEGLVYKFKGTGTIYVMPTLRI